MNRLGQISLILSLICFFVTFAVKVSLSGWMPFLTFGLGFGFFFLIFAVVINLKFFLHAFRSESLRFLGQSFLMVFIVFVILVSLNFILYKKNLTFDLTENSIHSLSDSTASLIKRIDGPIDFYYFHVGSNQSLQLEKIVRTEIEKYKKVSSKVSFQSHSLFKRPDLASRFQVGGEESSLFIEHKGKIQRVSDIQEKSMVNALLKVSKDPKTIYFWEDHEEKSLLATNSFGLSEVKTQLERLHYKLQTLKDLKTLPKDIALLAIVGSKQKISQDNYKILKDYFDQGGSLLIALDPDEDHNFDEFLAQFGVKSTGHFIFDQSTQAGQSKLYTQTYPGPKPHEIFQEMGDEQGPLFFVATSFEYSSKNESDYVYGDVLKYLPTSLARKDIDENSEILSRGEMLASLAIEKSKNPKGRMIVVGDSDFMNNQFLTYPKQFDFTLGLISYLTRDADVLDLKPVVAPSNFLILTTTQMNLYFLFYVLPMSALFFILALFFKLRRFY